MKTNPAGRGEQTIPADPATLYLLTRKLLYALAKRTLTAFRHESPGHPLPDLDELANEGFAALLDVLPRFDARKARFTTYAAGRIPARLRDRCECLAFESMPCSCGPTCKS